MQQRKTTHFLCFVCSHTMLLCFTSDTICVGFPTQAIQQQTNIIFYYWKVHIFVELAIQFLSICTPAIIICIHCYVLSNIVCTNGKLGYFNCPYVGTWLNNLWYSHVNRYWADNKNGNLYVILWKFNHHVI